MSDHFSVEYDSSISFEEVVQARLIANSKITGETLLSVIKRLLKTCDTFDFCVAFITDSGLQPLVQILAELKERGIQGRLLTSTYQSFNSPAVYRKLLEYENIEVRIFQGNLHAKGYLFRSPEQNTVVIGSSNLTQSALTCNREWNVLFHTTSSEGIMLPLNREFAYLWDSSETVALCESWIDSYCSYRMSLVGQNSARSTFYSLEYDSSITKDNTCEIAPNKMQEKALASLRQIHLSHQPRALLISATGTGKTYLSAFDVLAERPKRVLFLAHRVRILEASLRSYQKLLGDRYQCAMYNPHKDCSSATCLFAMCSTMSNHLQDFPKDYFDYIVVDEAHRTGASSYQKILSYFEPGFCLGMTATPNRTDGYDVFSLFNHVIAYQISLQDALESEMLVPFHYFGIADLSIDFESEDDFSLFSKLTSEERIRHIVQKIEEYTVDKQERRGLIFCSRNDEAAFLSKMFNELGYRTCALSGANSDAERNDAIRRLESGELEYIFSVDILNEGVDIPSLNQIIMLRRTESAIVFVQQLGRGLRKDRGKDFTLVLDFIGNYQKNFLVPVALSGDKTFNKDRLRSIVKGGGSCIPGASTISFDRISESRIYRAIDGGDFTAARFLRDEYRDLKNKLGRIPDLKDFEANGSIDPLLIFKKYGSYHAFLKKNEKDYLTHFSARQEGALKFVSQKLANGKRFEDLFLLKELIARRSIAEADLPELFSAHSIVTMRSGVIRSVAAVLHGDFSATAGFMPLVEWREGELLLADEFERCLDDAVFRRQLMDVVEFGLRRHESQYAELYKGTSFVLYAKYTYEEVCRLLCWDQNINSQNIGGYKYDAKTNTYPVFINYDKDPSISDSIKYEDRFISPDELVAISKQPRTLASPEIQRLKAWPGNGMKTYLFVRKNKDDKESKEFYFLGEMHPTGDFSQIIMPVVNKSAVEITYELDTPVRQDLYEYLLSDIEEGLES